jgi:hypothetical protein
LGKIHSAAVSCGILNIKREGGAIVLQFCFHREASSVWRGVRRNGPIVLAILELRSEFNGFIGIRGWRREEWEGTSKKKKKKKKRISLSVDAVCIVSK